MNDQSTAAAESQPRIRVGFNLPQWMVAKLDAEARRRGVTRQALIKMWLSDRLDRAA
ncbi:MAG: CopG antitoxin of type toxin-antitoxin system [Sphingomonadales bacterium]|nr:CopG antitoxin of type toxin-antitoxin system [Sphingomonadales bacterium]